MKVTEPKGRAGGEGTETDDELLVVDALLRGGRVFRGGVRVAVRVSTGKTGEHGTMAQLQQDRAYVLEGSGEHSRLPR